MRKIQRLLGRRPEPSEGGLTQREKTLAIVLTAAVVVFLGFVVWVTGELAAMVTEVFQ